MRRTNFHNGNIVTICYIRNITYVCQESVWLIVGIWQVGSNPAKWSTFHVAMTVGAYPALVFNFSKTDT